jgi:hypothetical protein
MIGVPVFDDCLQVYNSMVPTGLYIVSNSRQTDVVKRITEAIVLPTGFS